MWRPALLLAMHFSLPLLLVNLSKTLESVHNPLENIIVRAATPDDTHYADTITTEMEESAKARGTGIAKRSPEYISKKMNEGKAVIALTKTGEWVGFCYIEAWQHEKYVANSGLIVSPTFRHTGVAKEIKKRVFELSRKKYPDAKIFGLTTGLAVMKINSSLGYKPVTYSELTTDDEFWKGCQSCVNYDILMLKERKNCLCTGMLFDPASVEKENEKPATGGNQVSKTEVTSAGQLVKKREFKGNLKLFERWLRYKRYVLLNHRRRRDKFSAGNSAQSKKKFSLLSIFFWL